LLLILLCAALSIQARADHITGGEMFYTYSGFSGGQHHYAVTLKLYMRCFSGRSFPNPTIISIFDKTTNLRTTDLTVMLSHQTTISLPNEDPCISNPPTVCYEVAFYQFDVSVPESAMGYVIASQVNYRINGIANLQGGQAGATYVCEIPGNQDESTAPANNSALFTGSDLVIICANNFFSYSFSAVDDDGDQLRYSFCTAFNSSVAGTNGSAPADPPFNPLAYANPEFGETLPLGFAVNVDESTGMITGIAPGVGAYVVTVCVDEIRDGIVIATQRKDIQINIADCELAAATLPADYMLCGGSRSLTLNNLATSPLITTQDWIIKNSSGNVVFSQSGNQLNYTFPVNGTYTVKLYVNNGQPCSDSTECTVYVYPGFIPDFDFTGICITKPSTFHDLTTTVTGTVNSWSWDFGQLSVTNDVSSLQNPTYTYPTMGIRNVRLIVTNTDGCRDTVIKQISIIDKPPLQLAFRDTLICLGDQLQLIANTPGSYSWSPNTYLLNGNSSTPLVSPPVTTMYYADLDSDGCVNRDSVLVRVVDHVSLTAMPDSIICSGDTIRLRINSDGLKYSWTPAEQVLDAVAMNPLVITPFTSVYEVTATIGGCSTTEQIRITAIPYPLVNAGPDTTICFATNVQLQAITNGDSWQWSPASGLSNSSVLNPVATPEDTTSYIFKAYHLTSGCPKPAADTVIVNVRTRVIAFAGNDTAVVLGQALHLMATGGSRYEWQPPLHLSSAEIADPIAIFTQPSEGIIYRLNAFDEAGCMDSAFITVKVFATDPVIFVPSAFTPNNDGLNDILKPVAAGMAKIEYFMIYNRWGQLVYTSRSATPLWDGRINGLLQGSNTFVWLVKAIDYKGEAYFQKGTVTLIQ